MYLLADFDKIRCVGHRQTFHFPIIEETNDRTSQALRLCHDQDIRLSQLCRHGFLRFLCRFHLRLSDVSVTCQYDRCQSDTTLTRIVNQNVEPFPASEVTPISPPNRCTICLHMDYDMSIFCERFFLMKHNKLINEMIIFYPKQSLASLSWGRAMKNCFCNFFMRQNRTWKVVAAQPQQ